jgi:excisionase family DNA binding protein
MAIPKTDGPEYLTVEEAAALLRIGRTSAYALAREWRETGGRVGLPVVQMGRQLRVPRAALQDLHQHVGARGAGTDADPKDARLHDL